MPNAALSCPGCGVPMQRCTLERHTSGTVDVDLCCACQAIWFDTLESVQLAPAGVLALFREMQSAACAARRPLPARLPCPRCGIALRETHDLQHATRFTYWRCERGHGRLTPFVQFLREKDFIRPLPRDELARLKASVRTIRCSSCGAPVDLAQSTVCSYCGAPIVALDPDAVGAAIAKAGDAARAREAAPDLGRMIDALLAAQREEDRAGRGSMLDLVDAGVAAIGDWLRA